MSEKTLVTLIPGDGIGPEIAESVKRVFEAAKAGIEWEEVQAGLPTFESTGELLPANVMASIKKNKIALKGPTTTPSGKGHRSINVSLRQDFHLYANVRPIKSIPGIKCVYDNVDFIIVRENTEDLYRGIEYKIDKDTAHGIKIITRQCSLDVGRFACDMAVKLGRKKVTILHKANIMKLTDGLFLEAILSLQSEYPSLVINDMLVDAACMQMVKNPTIFDVIVTENLYGDIISDLGSGLIGGLGVASGGNFGSYKAIFEAVHGSAPDIAGKNLANPTALLLSAVTMLDFMGKGDVAKKIQDALFKTLRSPETRTRDLGGSLGTKEFTGALIANL